MDISTQRFNDMCLAIGQVVIPFAQIESSVDVIVAATFQNGGKAFEKELPRALNKRLKFIKTALKKMPQLSHLNDESIDAIGALENETEIRNNIVHGYLSNFEAATDTAEFTMLNAHMDKQMHTQLIYYYSIQSLLDTGWRLLKLGARFNTLAVGFARALVP